MLLQLYVTTLALVCTFVSSQFSPGFSQNCNPLFESFLDCTVTEVERRLTSLLRETNIRHRAEVNRCFDISRCTRPPFGNSDPVGVFLTEGKWKERVESILELLDVTPPEVQSCMVAYFKGLAERKVEDCVRTYGNSSVQNFRMPHIPGLEDFDVTKIKEVIIFRMLLRHGITQCVTPQNDPSIQRLISCVARSRQGYTENICQTREDCRDNRIIYPTCVKRFDAIHEAGCRCGREELSNGGVVGALGRWDELRNGLFQGGIEDSFRECYRENDLPFPQDKMNKVKSAIRLSIVDIILRRNVPDELKYTFSVARDILTEFVDNWKDFFCTNCTDGTGGLGEEIDIEIASLRLVAERARNATSKSGQPESSRGSILSRFGGSGLFGSLLGRRTGNSGSSG